MDHAVLVMYVLAIHNGMGVLLIARLVCVHSEQRG